MEKFMGSALLVDVDTYMSVDKKTGESTDKFKYSFLCGRQGKKDEFVKSPSLETFISDNALIKVPKFMSEIKVAITLISYKDKDKSGKIVDMYKPVYEVLSDFEV